MDVDMDPYEEAEAAAAATDEESTGEDDSEAESDYEEKSYGLLTSSRHRVRNPDGTFRCPFCPGKKKQGYRLKDLLQHADGIGASSKCRRRGRERAAHRAFARFVRTDPAFAHDLAWIDGAAGANATATAARKVIAVGRSTGSSSVAAAIEPPPEEKFAWPWTAILAAGAGFDAQGFADAVAIFNPDAVAPLVEDEAGVKGTFAIVRFTEGWGQFDDVLALDNHFSESRLGKKEWEASNCDGGAANGEENRGYRGGEIHVYGWVAQEVDYNAGGVVGRYLRNYTDLMTLKEIERRMSEPLRKKLEVLVTEVDEKNEVLRDLESKYNVTGINIARLEKDTRELHEAHIQEMKNHRGKDHENALRIFQENDNLKLELERRKRELNSHSKKLKLLAAENDNDRKKLNEEKQNARDSNSELELASIERQRADEDFMELVEDQKREEEDVLETMLQQEKELHDKHQLELQVTGLTGKLQVMKLLVGDDDRDIQYEMKRLSERLEHEKERLEELIGNLVTKDRESNDELQEVRGLLKEELLKGSEDMLSGETDIGIKIMGEIDEKPFLEACKKKYGNQDYEDIACKLISRWQKRVKTSSWHPFKTIEANGETKRVIRNNDEKLLRLGMEYGHHVCNAVKTALVEMIEHNPSGGYTVPELWNFGKGRRATIKEVLEYMLAQMQTTGKRRGGRLRCRGAV